MLPLFWKVTDDTKHFEIAGAEVAVLGSIKGMHTLTFVGVLIETTLEPETSTRVNTADEL